MVINCTPQSLSAAGSGRAVSLSSAASSAGPRRSGSPCGRPSRQLQSRSRFTRAEASTHCAPPSCSQTCSSRVPNAAVSWRDCRRLKNSMACNNRSTASRPSALRSCHRSERRSGTGRARNSGESAPTSVCRSASERPHQGERRTPSHATRSCGLRSARARASTSIISGRSCSFSSSTARNGMEVWRSAAAMGSSDLRARPSTAMRYLFFASRAWSTWAMWLRISVTSSSICFC